MIFARYIFLSPVAYLHHDKNAYNSQEKLFQQRNLKYGTNQISRKITGERKKVIDPVYNIADIYGGDS